MSNTELSIWAAMLGALLTFFGAALADAIRNPTIAAWRALCFILLTGGSAVVMSGWVEQVAGIDNTALLLPAKVSLGPLSGALALLYLGIWFGKLTQDALLDRLIHWGSMAQSLAALALLIGISLYPMQGLLFLKIAFAVNLLSVLMALMAAVRGMTLGDRLAAAMVVACVCLGVMVIGLYSKGLGWASSNVLWVLTAISTTTYFLITTVLTIQRNRQLRLIVKMSEGIAKTDEITGLPVGGTLLSKIDDAVWRSVRIECECAVMAVWIDNLYLYNDQIDGSIEHEIRHVLAARIRRAVGFRHVLGLQQSRCFVAGISAIKHRERVISKATDLALNLRGVMQVGVMLGQAHDYEPKIGMGLVFVGLGHMADPLSAMDQAQALAKKALREPSRVLHEEASATSFAVSHKTAPETGL
jgi:GGDEF domain-containing protein